VERQKPDSLATRDRARATLAMFPALARRAATRCAVRARYRTLAGDAGDARATNARRSTRARGVERVCSIAAFSRARCVVDERDARRRD